MGRGRKSSSVKEAARPQRVFSEYDKNKNTFWRKHQMLIKKAAEVTECGGKVMVNFCPDLIFSTSP